MGSFSGACEIIEVEDEPGSVQSSKLIHQEVSHKKSQKSPFLKPGSNNSLEDDINKLFEVIHLKQSPKSLHLSEQAGMESYRRKTLKKPIRVGVPRSPGIGFSEPVSLKEALRGLSISQASEMAAMKRSLKSGSSPRFSEASNIETFYRSLVVETGESSGSLNKVNAAGLETSQVVEESMPTSYANLPQYLSSSGIKSSSHSAHSSPLSSSGTSEKGTRCAPVQNQIMPVTTEDWCQTSKKESLWEEKHAAAPSLSCHNSGDRMVQLKMRTSQSVHSSPQFDLTTIEKGTRSTVIKNEIPVSKEIQSQILGLELLQEEEHAGISSLLSHHTEGTIESGTISAPTEIGNKASAPKSRLKSKPQSVPSSSTAFKSNKGIKSTRKPPNSVKSVLRNKPVLMKNLKQDLTSVGSISNTNKETAGNSDPSNDLLFCERCQCALKNVGDESNKDSPALSSIGVTAQVSSGNMNSGGSKLSLASNKCSKSRPMVEKANNNLRTRDKGDFSQSSNSSLGEHSSSTSISEESSLSGSSFGNRPHMSKDLKWEAIQYVKKQQGFLGLGHFNLLKKLGSGDIGTVYLAELIGANCLFALKVMDNEFLARRKKLPRAQTEREILRILDHPFLPTLYAQFTSDNLSCLVMEYCPGGDLHVLRQKQPDRYFPEQTARFYVAEVLLALEYLHMLGIIYRDLKPENILVREDGHIMVTDFDLSLRCDVSPTLVKSSSSSMEPPRMSGPCTGSSCIDPFCVEPYRKVTCFSPRLLSATAKARKLKTDLAAQARLLPQLVAEPTDARSNSFVGTHEYLAPEIIKGEGHGSAVDWWTFGIFLYELLYGRTPFKGAGNEETLANVVLQNLKFPESPLVSFQARDLIQGLLVKEPENRLGSEKGAAEIKQHPFFDGLNWALIRCAIPPQVPEVCDIATLNTATKDKGTKYLEYGATGEHLEFELF